MRLATETLGISHRDELRRSGCSDDKIDWMVKSGRWQRVYPRVYATFRVRFHIERSFTPSSSTPVRVQR
jgi:hypothetical protein